MNLEKFTDRAKGFLQAAQTIAIRMNHQRISPEHIANALLEDNEGMAAGLIQRAGGDVPRAVAGIDALLAKVPAASGSGAQQTPGLDNDAVRLLDQAEQVATKAGDGYVTVERLLLAMVLASSTPVGKAFADAGVKADALNTVINELRRGRTARHCRRRAIQRTRQSNGVRPAQPLAKPLGQGLVRHGHGGIGDAGKQAHQCRTAQPQAPGSVLRHNGMDSKRAILHSRA